MKELTDADYTRIGEHIAVLLNLKEARDQGTRKKYTPARYETAWGTKTAQGLARSMQRIMEGDAP